MGMSSGNMRDIGVAMTTSIGYVHVPETGLHGVSITHWG